MKIDIVGKGNVGIHLYKAFHGKADVQSVDSRSLKNLRHDSDLYIICVSDTAIREVASKLCSLINRNSVIAHTSGTTPLSVFEGLDVNAGVFYPLQTFSKSRELDYTEIPVFIEAGNQTAVKTLTDAALVMGCKVKHIDSEQRKHLHIGSILACNFVNHLWTLSDNYLKAHNLDFESLLPLIKETYSKISEINPSDAQTGPAVRNDEKTLRSHLDMLKEDGNLSEIYRILSDSIKNTHNIGKP